MIDTPTQFVLSWYQKVSHPERKAINAGILSGNNIMSSKKARERGNRNILILAVIAISIYIGFEPLIELVPEGVARSVVSSSFGAIFVIILTMYLLNKQTEIEQESKRSERVFDEKVKLYQQIMDIMRDMLLDSKISNEEINRLPFPVVKLQMIGGDAVIHAFMSVNNKLNAIYAASDDDEVAISEDDRNSLFKLLLQFAGECRSDLSISEEKLDAGIIDKSVETVAETGKKARDYQKFSFDGEDLSKARYIHRIIKTFADESPGMTLADFNEAVPRDADFNKNVWVTFEEAIEISERDRRRHYIRDSEKIYLSDATVCVRSGQSLESTLNWIEFFKSKGIRTS